MRAGEGVRRRTGAGSGQSTPSPRDIPDKLYFRIGEVARLCDVPAYVLRFWETEFPQLRPNKGGTGQRLFRRRDVEMALRIRALLYDEGYTIAGARQTLKTEGRAGSGDGTLAVVAPPSRPGVGAAPTEAAAADPDGDERGQRQHLLRLRRELRDLHALLSRPPGSRSAGAAVHPIRPARPEPVAPSPNAPVPFPRPRLLKPSSPQRTDDLFGALFDSDDLRR